MVFSDYIWQDCPDTGRITYSYILFYQVGTIDRFTHVPGPVAQSSNEIKYNSAFTAVMTLSRFIIINNELMNKYTYVFPKQSHIIILDRKSSLCMAPNGKDTKHTRYIDRIMYLFRNFEEFNLHKTLWCEVGL